MRPHDVGELLAQRWFHVDWVGFVHRIWIVRPDFHPCFTFRNLVHASDNVISPCHRPWYTQSNCQTYAHIKWKIAIKSSYNTLHMINLAKWILKKIYWVVSLLLQKQNILTPILNMSREIIFCFRITPLAMQTWYTT